MSEQQALVKPTIPRIDFRQGILTGKSGKTYWIMNDLSAWRYTFFIAYQPMITKGATYVEIAAANDRIVALLTSGNDLLKNHHEAASIAINQKQVLKEFDEKRYHAVMFFAMLFINETEENPGDWDLRLARQKIDDLNHYSMQDFFFLVGKVLKEWESAYRSQH